MLPELYSERTSPWTSPRDMELTQRLGPFPPGPFEQAGLENSDGDVAAALRPLVQLVSLLGPLICDSHVPSSSHTQELSVTEQQTRQDETRRPAGYAQAFSTRFLSISRR